MLINEVAPKLKPGQEKDLKIEIKGLQDLFEKVKKFELEAYKAGVLFDPAFKNETDILKSAIEKKIQTLKAQIEKEKPKAAGEFIKFWNKTIVPNCSEILTVYNSTKKVLYRGSSRAPSTAFVGRSLENREPKDSNKSAQELFDTALTALGIKALRRNSIFATADFTRAERYGVPYIILPVNGFNFSYTSSHDLVLETIDEVIDKKIVQKIGKIIKKANLDPERFNIEQYGNEFELNEWDFDPKTFLTKIKKNSKLANDPFIKSLTPSAFINLASFKKQYKPSGTNLAKALKAEVEVCVNGTYYAFRHKEYGTLIEDLLGFKLSTGEH